MADFDTIAPIDDAEILYRRIPLSTGWYQPDKQPPLEPEAFRPTRFDSSGLSVSRKRYTSLELAARGQPGKVYYVAVFRTGDLREWRSRRIRSRAILGTRRYRACGTTWTHTT